MYIDVVPNRKSPPAVLLRQSRRDGGKIVKTTLANLSQCPPEAVAALRLALRGVALVPHEEVFAVERSIPHGHVQAVLGVMRTVGMDALLAARPCRERALVLAMIAQRLLDPCSKLATTRVWHTTTLAQELGVADADANDLYAALDWLQQRQGRIEKKLAARHLTDGAVVLFDVSSSSYHGRTCPLARRGYNRDGDKLPSIVYGLLTDGAGRPIAVDVYPGNTGDPSTVPDQVEKLRMRFRLQRVVLVGDRGMLTHTQINALRGHPGVGWISALRFPAIRALAEHGAFQPSLFDTPHLAEITSDAYPGERLVVCYNPALAADRARTRDELLAATEARLARIAAAVARRTKTPMTADEIGVKVGKIINHYTVGKHFDVTIEDARLRFERNDASIAREAPLDGIYILRTSERADAVSAADVVRTYKSLGHVEQAFRCMKGIDLRVRPIRHRNEGHVRAHMLLVHARLLRRTPAARRLVDRPLPRRRPRRGPLDPRPCGPGRAVRERPREKAHQDHRRRLARAEPAHRAERPGDAVQKHLPRSHREERPTVRATDRNQSVPTARLQPARTHAMTDCTQ